MNRFFPYYCIVIKINRVMYYKVLKQVKPAPGQQPGEPELFIVEQGELEHFLHEQESPTAVLVF